MTRKLNKGQPYGVMFALGEETLYQGRQYMVISRYMRSRLFETTPAIDNNDNPIRFKNLKSTDLVFYKISLIDLDNVLRDPILVSQRILLAYRNAHEKNAMYGMLYGAKSSEELATMRTANGIDYWDPVPNKTLVDVYCEFKEACNALDN